MLFRSTDYGKNAHRDKGTPEPKSGAPAGEGGGSDGAKSEPKSADAPAAATPSAPAGEKKKADPKGAEKPSVAAPKKSTGE